MVCLRNRVDGQTCRGVQSRGGGDSHWGSKVISEESTFLAGLGNWVLREYTHMRNIPFFKTHLPKLQEKYVLRYFSASLQNFPMCSEDKVRPEGENLDTPSQKANRGCVIFKRGPRPQLKEFHFFPAIELNSQKSA